MCSPVFSKALGECNAIRSWGFGPSELTFVSALETEFSASHACRSSAQHRGGQHIFPASGWPDEYEGASVGEVADRNGVAFDGNRDSKLAEVLAVLLNQLAHLRPFAQRNRREW